MAVGTSQSAKSIDKHPKPIQDVYYSYRNDAVELTAADFLEAEGEGIRHGR